MLIFVLVIPAGATFYEVNGMIKWENQPLSNVDAYLIPDSADFVKECNKDEKIILEVALGNFYESYRSLEQKIKKIRKLDGGEKKK